PCSTIPQQASPVLPVRALLAPQESSLQQAVILTLRVSTLDRLPAIQRELREEPIEDDSARRRLAQRPLLQRAVSAKWCLGAEPFRSRSRTPWLQLESAN